MGCRLPSYRPHDPRIVDRLALSSRRPQSVRRTSGWRSLPRLAVRPGRSILRWNNERATTFVRRRADNCSCLAELSSSERRSTLNLTPSNRIYEVSYVAGISAIRLNGCSSVIRTAVVQCCGCSARAGMTHSAPITVTSSCFVCLLVSDTTNFSRHRSYCELGVPVISPAAGVVPEAMAVPTHKGWGIGNATREISRF